MGARYSISNRAIRVAVPAPGVASKMAVDARCGSSDTQNAWIRASSRIRSNSALLTCEYASISDQRSGTSTVIRDIFSRVQTVSRELTCGRSRDGDEPLRGRDVPPYFLHRQRSYLRTSTSSRGLLLYLPRPGCGSLLGRGTSGRAT